MRGQVLLEHRNLVPRRVIDPQMDFLASPSVSQPAQQAEERLGVPLRSAHRPVSTLQRSHPAEHMQPLPVFTAGGHLKGLPAARRDPTQAGMHWKSRSRLQTPRPLFSSGGEVFFKRFRNVSPSPTRFSR